MTLIRITIRFSTGLLPQDQYDDNWWLLLLNRILTHFKLGTVWKPLWIHATSKSFWMQNSRGKINPTPSLKLPTWGAENPKTKTQVSQYGGQQRNKDRHPGQQDGSHVQVKNTLILHFKTLQFIEDSKKTKKRIIRKAPFWKVVRVLKYQPKWWSQWYGAQQQANNAELQLHPRANYSPIWYQ